ncbi:RNase adapter RapZ [Novosphingobium sp. PS1R-30]|uniref:RNase adapter RapZ n=1 Tax=Novosphingobium anseongense TaxID=3133436 RepID=A0ABU8RQZ4_9SPHN|nr:MAG: RNase adapter RapZ [Novosphingobium sp.]
MPSDIEDSGTAQAAPDAAPGQGLPQGPQRILLVTGLLGAGKTTVLRVLEDLRWEALDNFPVRLLERLIDTTASQSAQAAPADRPPLAIGFDARTRGFNPHDIIERVKKLSKRADLEVTTLFLDCASRELERRYNETRRRHPLAADMPVASGILAERELLEPLRRWADGVIDTTAYSTNDLQQVIRERFTPTDQPLTLTVSSFGFSRGMPPVADLVFDMRFLDNPHWVDELRPLTGKDAPVGEHIRQDPAFPEAYDRIRDLLLLLLPRYEAQGKAYVHIAFGCTGGRHRSVFVAEQIAAALRAAGFSPTLLHRNLGSRAADLIEGGQAS